MRSYQLPLIAQVREAELPHDGLHMEGVVVPHLGHAARKRRLAADVKLIRVAYLLDRSEATLSRFERGEVQPADVDAVVLAYARELGINPLALWADALELARTEGVTDDPRPAGDDLRDAPLFAAPGRRTQASPPARKSPTKARRRAS